MPLDHATFNQVTRFLEPYLDESGRSALLTRAFYGITKLTTIPQSGDNATFAVRLVKTLDDYGTIGVGDTSPLAIVHLLRVLREDYGGDVQQRFDELIDTIENQAVTAESTQAPRASQVAPAEDSAPAPATAPTLQDDDSLDVPAPGRLRRLMRRLGMFIASLGGGFALFAFVGSAIWGPNASQLCNDANFIACGWDGPPQPRMSDFVVVVAGFGWAADDGEIVQDAQADAVSLTVANALADDLTFADQIIDIEDPQFRLYPGRVLRGQQTAPHIIAPTADERRAAATHLAAALNADMVVYGIVREANNILRYAPEFHVADLLDTADVTQFANLGLLTDEITVSSAQTTNIQAGNIATRLSIYYSFLQAITGYAPDSYATAIAHFEETIQQSGNSPDMALVYVLLGNATGRAASDDDAATAAQRQRSYVDALDFYQKALKLRPNYSRALIGTGEALAALFEAQFRQYDPATELPHNVDCLSFDLETLPDDAQLLGLLALDCYQKARDLTSVEATVDAQEEFIRAVSGIGSINLTFASLGADTWEAALDAFEAGIARYEPLAETYRPQSLDSVGHVYARYAITRLYWPQNRLTCDEHERIDTYFATGFALLGEQPAAYSTHAENNCQQSAACNAPSPLCDENIPEP